MTLDDGAPFSGWVIPAGCRFAHFFFPWREISACGTLMRRDQMPPAIEEPRCPECERRLSSGEYLRRDRGSRGDV